MLGRRNSTIANKDVRRVSRPVQMLFHIHTSGVGALIQDAKPRIMVEEAGHAQALLFTCWTAVPDQSGCRQ
jgi:hypothetical protein